jgi:hypothetical protein
LRDADFGVEEDGADFELPPRALTYYDSVLI